MNDASVPHTQILSMNHGDRYSSMLLAELVHFVDKHYVLTDNDWFEQEVLKINQKSDLALYYDKRNQLIGFTHLMCQSIRVDDKPIIVFSGGTYHDQRVNPSFAAAKFGLTQAMKYKLANPHEELVYFANANTPARYQFLRKLSNTVYPSPSLRIPDKVLKLVAKLKQVNHWPSHTAHPMIISNQLAMRDEKILSVQEQDEYSDYYYSVNPDYKAGNSLLVFLPLNLSTISEGIKRVVTEPALPLW